MSILRKIAPLAAATVMLLGFAAGAAGSPAGFKAPTGPQPGDCKRVAEHAIGANPVHAENVWSALVNAKFGGNWARWPAAQEGYVAPTGNGQFVAIGKPCFSLPIR